MRRDPCQLGKFGDLWDAAFDPFEFGLRGGVALSVVRFEPNRQMPYRTFGNPSTRVRPALLVSADEG